MWARTAFPAHAEAVEPSRLLAVPRDTLRRELSRNPELAMGMLAGLSAKLREFNLLIERLSLMEVPAHLAGVLLELAEKAGSTTFGLPQTKRSSPPPSAPCPKPSARAGQTQETGHHPGQRIANPRAGY